MAIWIVVVIVILTIAVFSVLLRNKKTKVDGLANPEMSVKQTDELKMIEISLQNSLGDQLVFKQPKLDLNSSKKYYEVLGTVNQVSGQIVQTSLPIAQQAMTVAQIAKAAPNGLFTTLADPTTLSKFQTDGTFTTMVRDSSGNLTKHQGFTSVSDIAGNNPLLAVNIGMQGAAFVAGQYYMHQINSQLGTMTQQLGQLVEFHNNEKVASLMTAQKRLLKIAGKVNVDEADINEIRLLLKDATNVYMEYKNRLAQQITELERFESKAWSEKNRLNALIEKLEAINFTIKICYEADQLNLQSALSEIAVRMKLGNANETIEEQFEKIQAEYKDSFYANFDSYIQNEYSTIVKERYRHLGEKYLVKHRDKIREITQLVKQPQIEVSNQKITDLSRLMFSDQHKKQEIIYVPGQDPNSQRIFIEKAEVVQ